MNLKNNPVGVFDSGVGGISVLRDLRRILPEEDFLYFGDTANAPYGTKTTAEVIRLSRQVVEHLTSQGIKALVIACNTATGAAAATLRKELTIPVIGMEPALKPASLARKDRAVLVLATPLTLNQEKFRTLMERYGEGAVKVPCPEGALRYLRELFLRYPAEQVDAVVLGCTHYVFLKDMIRGLLPERIVLTDGNEGTARQLDRVLRREGLRRDPGAAGAVKLETSGTEADLALLEKLLDRGISA